MVSRPKSAVGNLASASCPGNGHRSARPLAAVTGRTNYLITTPTCKRKMTVALALAGGHRQTARRVTTSSRRTGICRRFTFGPAIIAASPTCTTLSRIVSAGRCRP